jgi:hypothetical protein
MIKEISMCTIIPILARNECDDVELMGEYVHCKSCVCAITDHVTAVALKPGVNQHVSFKSEAFCLSNTISNHSHILNARTILVVPSRNTKFHINQ